MNALLQPALAPRRHLAAWTFTHLTAATRGVGLLFGGGLWRELRRRTFSWRGLLAALAVFAAALAATTAWAVRQDLQGLSLEVTPAFAVTLLGAACAGAAAGWVSGKVAFWELQATLAVACAALWPALAGVGMGASVGGRPVWALVPGERLFGPLWDRLLGLWIPLAFASALVGASSALFCRGLGRRGPQGPGFALAWRLAWRRLGGRSRGPLSGTASVAVLGVALGVAALVATTAVMSGYQDDVRGRILGTNAHLVVQRYGVDFTGYEDVIAAVRDVPGVVAASPFAFNEAMLAGAGQATGVLLKGVDPVRAPTVTDLGRDLCLTVTGTGASAVCTRVAATKKASDAGATHLAQLLVPATAGTAPPLLVGLSLYRRLNLPLGSRVRLLTPVGMAGSRGNAPRRKSFVLAGVIATGMHEFDSRLVVTSLAASQDLLGLGRAVSGVELKLEDPFAAEAVGKQVLSRIGRYPYRLVDWRQLNAGIFTALSLQKVVMFLVLAFIVVVASFNVASTLLMAVSQRAHDVAVLKAMGAPDGVILQTFLYEGWLTGLLGLALGLALGLGATFVLSSMQLAIAADVYMVDAVRVRLRPGELAMVCGCTLIICHLAALVPALHAAEKKGQAPG